MAGMINQELIEERLKNMEEKIDHIKDRVNYTSGIMEDVRDMETQNANKINNIHTVQEKHDKYLWNGGQNGLIMRVDRLEQADKNRKWTWDRIISIIGIAAVVVMEIAKSYSN